MRRRDSLYDTLFPGESSEVCKEKSHHSRRTMPRTTEPENRASPFQSSTNPGGAWLAAIPRITRRLGRYLLIFVVAITAGFQAGRMRHAPAPKCDLPLSSLPEARASELRDTLIGYKHRGEGCSISSLDLHVPSGSVCKDKSSMLKAMSSGGRVGRDAPFAPRGCDMQWFSTLEVCQILGRYSQVILVGDSMLRHVIGALNVLIREDLGYGGVTDWNFDENEKYEGGIPIVLQTLVPSSLI